MTISEDRQIDSTEKSLERVQELITRLNLRHLNGEAGLYSVVRVSDLEITASDGNSPVSNAIYFMLTREEPQNYVHWLFSDDYQALIEGGPADYYLFHEDGSVEKQTMGRDIAAGQTLFVPVPAGTRKAIVLHESASHLLVSSVVTPAWSPQRARIGGGSDFIEKYKGRADWATIDHLKFLIGPNLEHEMGADGQGFNVLIDESGQIIWQGMQLNLEQTDYELKQVASASTENLFTITLASGAPEEPGRQIEALARSAGLGHIEIVRL